ncbi:hypothetical protein F5B22DRAFT_589600 [Xylaria bambusicola]|uniref:uncharacterized protein n=1 Tax=Xylaria bambusicola TaxID=326684 RepID=UPI002008A8FC|nr:uncharacterized protein F5B22DRAFT_589600 [Xylaria bambusicola]KAI0525368.1 hypothetical protein F5B22DRAFT_589600 [Xylaria bambusicola]
MRRSHVVVALSALAHRACAVLVAQHSPCESSCGNVLDSTTQDQIVCNDADYGTSAGKVLQSCVTCESRSTYTVTGQNQPASDLQAMLFNMRYTAAQCIFYKDGGPCSTDFSCKRLRGALEYGNFSTDVSPYGYCSLWSDYDLSKCTNCLQAGDQAYVRNFVSILSGACELKVEPPSIIPLEGDIFSLEMANVTKPTATATVQVHNKVGPLSYGALAGVVIGGVAFILVLLGCGVVINGKRRRKNYLRRREEQAKNWPSPQAAGDMFETPLSQKPLRGGWGDSPVSAVTSEGHYQYPRYFSPYTTQFDSPISSVDGYGQPAWPIEKAQSIGVALSPDHDHAESPWGDRKGKEKADASVDGYELQEGVNSAGGYGFQVPPPPPIPSTAPVLNHPGYGRQGQARRTPSPS